MNRLSGGGKGRIIKIDFSVENKHFECYVPDDQYWISIKDILLNREYEFLPEFELRKFKGKLVVDAGSHVGIFSLVASVFAKKVVSIEPHPINYKLLEINKIKNNCKNIVTINKALVGRRTKKIKIYSKDLTSSATIKYENAGENTGYYVPTITLQEIVETYGKIDLLKIDVEGSEFNIFKELSKETLNKIKAIVGEIHLEYGELHPIINILEGAGYKVWYFHPPLIKNSSKSTIKLDDLVRLKFLRELVYLIVSLGKMKDKKLVILFAKKS